MAPNRKQIQLITNSLAELDLVQPKFLPLTHPESEQLVEPATAKAAQTVSAPLASYWDWPADDVVLEEEAKDFFSCATLEQNLIKDAQRLASTTATVVNTEDAAAHLGYWDEATTSSTTESVTTKSVTTKPQHVDYWTWPAAQEEKQALYIRAVLAEETARNVVATDRVVRNLLSAPQKAVKPQDSNHDDYWAWQSPAGLLVSDSLDEVYSHSYWEWQAQDRSSIMTNKAVLLASILQDEANRQLFSAVHIEANLMNTKVSCSEQETSNDDYWSWSSDAQEQDHYWDWSFRPTVAAGSDKSYWVW